MNPVCPVIPPFTSKTSIMTASVWVLTFVTTQKKLPSSSGITGGVKMVAALAATANTAGSALASRNLLARLIMDLLRSKRRYLRGSGPLLRSGEIEHWLGSLCTRPRPQQEQGSQERAHDPHANRGPRLHECAGYRVGLQYPNVAREPALTPYARRTVTDATGGTKLSHLGRRDARHDTAVGKRPAPLPDRRPCLRSSAPFE